MGDQLRNFGETAKGLAWNPLGIIALFIVLVYVSALLWESDDARIGSLSPYHN